MSLIPNEGSKLSAAAGPTELIPTEQLQWKTSKRPINLIIKSFLCEGGSSSRKHIFYMVKDDAHVAYYASPVILITFVCPLFH